jgi:hypothetical protein
MSNTTEPPATTLLDSHLNHTGQVLGHKPKLQDGEYDWSELIASLQARLEAAERDAARYRWLRNEAISKCTVAPAIYDADDFALWGDECDAAIDSATQEGKG